jgi:hypothetical protein
MEVRVMLNGFLAACMLLNAPIAQNNRTIVRLVGQHATVTISSSATGPVYSATDSHGKSIVKNATIEELRANHPELYRQINPAVCVEADARLIADSN